MFRFRIIFGILVLILPALGWAANPNDLFRKANTAYTQGNYAVAIEQYQQIIEQGSVSAELFYNLGNAYLQADDLAEAILYYEKALNASPSDDRIKKNLELARDKVDTPVIDIPDFFLLRMWKSFANMLSPSIWIIIQLGFGLLLIYGFYLWQLNAISAMRFRGFGLSLLALCLLGLSYMAGNTSHNLRTGSDHGILMVEQTLRSGPDKRSDEIEVLSEGVKVKIEDQFDNWYKVSLMNKTVGYLPKEDISTI